MKTYIVILVLSLLTVGIAQAFQSTSTSENQTQNTKRFLNGKLLSWTNESIKTTVGTYQINHEIAIEDTIGTGKKTYAKDEAKPNVQLIFEENRLIKAIIYQ